MRDSSLEVKLCLEDRPEAARAVWGLKRAASEGRSQRAEDPSQEA